MSDYTEYDHSNRMSESLEQRLEDGLRTGNPVAWLFRYRKDAEWQVTLNANLVEANNSTPWECIPLSSKMNDPYLILTANELLRQITLARQLKDFEGQQLYLAEAALHSALNPDPIPNRPDAIACADAALTAGSEK